MSVEFAIYVKHKKDEFVNAFQLFRLSTTPARELDNEINFSYSINDKDEYYHKLDSAFLGRIINHYKNIQIGYENDKKRSENEISQKLKILEHTNKDCYSMALEGVQEIYDRLDWAKEQAEEATYCRHLLEQIDSMIGWNNLLRKEDEQFELYYTYG